MLIVPHSHTSLTVPQLHSGSPPYIFPPLSFPACIFETSPFSSCETTHHLPPPLAPQPVFWSGWAYQDPGGAADYAGSCQPFQVRPPRRQFNCFRLRLCHRARQKHEQHREKNANGSNQMSAEMRGGSAEERRVLAGTPDRLSFR